MKLRYKGSTETFSSSRFNTFALSEVLTGDDSAYIRDLDVFVNGQWKCLSQAFKDGDVVPNNYNDSFAEPRSDRERDQGYNDY